MVAWYWDIHVHRNVLCSYLEFKNDFLSIQRCSQTKSSYSAVIQCPTKLISDRLVYFSTINNQGSQNTITYAHERPNDDMLQAVAWEYEACRTGNRDLLTNWNGPCDYLLENKRALLCVCVCVQNLEISAVSYILHYHIYILNSN